MGTCEGVDTQGVGLGAQPPGARLTSRTRGGAPEGKRVAPEDTAGIQEHRRSLGAQVHIVRPKPHLSSVGLAVKDRLERVDAFCTEKKGGRLGSVRARTAANTVAWP